MRPLWLVVVAAAGRARTALVVASTAVVSGLLLVAVSYARLGGQDDPAADAPLLGPIADPGTRGGSILAVVLVAVPVALLLDQCVRLGASAQRRRYAALAVAGATRRDLRRWGALETGGPALLGGLLGVVVWWLMRLVLGHLPAASGHAALVPTATGPGLWALLVVALVAAYGGLVGRRAAARAVADARRKHRPPRPWGPVLVGLSLVLLVAGLASDAAGDTLWLLGVVVLAVAGIALSTPWLAYVVSGVVTRRTQSATVLLATRRIRSDHGAAGRAAAAVGAVGLALGVLGVLVADLLITDDTGDRGYYLVPAAIVGVLALLALGVITLSLSLHSVEGTLERRRELTALVATGVPEELLEEAGRVECRLVTLPVTLGAALLGALLYSGLAASLVPALGGLVGVAVAGGAVRVAVRLSSRATRPWLREALAAGNLRTE